MFSEFHFIFIQEQAKQQGTDLIYLSVLIEQYKYTVSHNQKTMLFVQCFGLCDLFLCFSLKQPNKSIHKIHNQKQ